MFTVAYAVSDDGYLNVRSKLIARNATTVIYCDDYAEGGLKPFYTVTEGTIIADTFFEQGDYYELHTGHDYLFIKKSDVIIK